MSEDLSFRFSFNGSLSERLIGHWLGWGDDFVSRVKSAMGTQIEEESEITYSGEARAIGTSVHDRLLLLNSLSA